MLSTVYRTECRISSGFLCNCHEIGWSHQTHSSAVFQSNQNELFGVICFSDRESQGAKQIDRLFQKGKQFSFQNTQKTSESLEIQFLVD